MPPAQNLTPRQATRPEKHAASKGPPDKPANEVEEPPLPPPVKPVIFRYTCRGALFLDDDRTGGSASSSPLGRSGQFDGAVVPPSLPTPRCVGIESRLRKIRELPAAASRDEAVRDFVERAAVLDVGYDGRGGRERGEAAAAPRTSGRIGGATLGGPDKPRLGPPAALPVGPDAADYGEGEEDDGGDLRPKRRLSGGVKVGADEDEPGGDSWSNLSCYGTTQVSVLMLRDSKRAEVAAVAPENTLGITVRDEGDSTGGEATTTLRIGPIEVTVGNHYEFEEEGEEQQEMGSSARDQGKDQGGGSVGGRREDGMRPTAWPPGVLEDRGKGRKAPERPVWDPNQGTEGIRPMRGEGKRPQGGRPRIPREDPSSSESDEDFSERLLRTLQRTAEAMKKNAKTVQNEVNDDFPNRVVRSGERIVGQFGKTLERTKKVAMDVYRMWSSDDDDHDDK